MRRFALLTAAAALSLVGCKDVTSGNITPAIAEDYIGVWTLHVPPVANCWNAFQLQYEITITHVDAFRGQHAFNWSDAQGWWPNGVMSDRNPINGNINGNDQTFSLDLARSSDPDVAAHFQGGSPNKNFLAGSFTDPDGVFKTMTGTRPCETVAQAVRAN